MYGFGFMVINHINEFSKEYPDEDYEKLFIDFFIKNYQNLIESGAENFEIYMEIYYSDQCNFEIFNNKYLKILSKYNVNLPISVYHIKE